MIVEVSCGPVSGGGKFDSKRRVAGALIKGFEASSSEVTTGSVLKKRQVKQLTKRPTKRLIKPVDDIVSYKQNTNILSQNLLYYQLG